MNTKTNCAMNASHTPGKWKLSPSGQCVMRDEPDEPLTFVAMICNSGSDACHPLPREAEANAQLIALAPTLLAQRDALRAALELTIDTLKRVYKSTGRFSSIQGTLDVALTALNKSKD